MAPIAKPLKLRLFLEGEEVPVIAAQVAININATATATIQVVPVDSVMDLLPRTMVHLFFLDTEMSSSDGSYAGSRHTYRLLFAGEFVGYSFVQTPQSRAIILQCLDFSNYWDFAHASSIEYGPGSNPFFDSSAIYGGNPGVFDDIIDQQPNRLVEWLKQKPKTPGLTNVSGLAGGVISILEAIGGVPGYSKGINDFFTMAELRCRILNQIVAEENDYTAANVLDIKVFHEWLKNGLQNMGKTVTFRDLLKLLFQYIFYEFIPNPAAKWEESVNKGGPHAISSKPYPLANTPGGRSVIASLVEARSYLGPMTLGNTAEEVSYVKNSSANALRACQKARTTLKTIVAPKPEFKNKLSVISTQLDELIGSLTIINKDGVKYFATVYSGLSTRVDMILDLIGEAGGEYRSVTYKTDSSAQRLKSQIIRPDCWFSAPPKCNVIFPEYYTQFQYERAFVSEVTRSLVQFGIELIGPDQLLDNYVMFPNAALTGGPLAKKKGEAGYRFLMDHEIHTGIIPRSEWLPDTASVGARGDPILKKKVKDLKMNWTNRAGLFHFFKYRFAPRQASVNMRFNPFLVCGFPSVVLRQPYIINGLTSEPGTPTKEVFDELSRRAREPGSIAPYQFVGMIGSLSHNIDQNGGTTSVSMHHVRRHSGIDDEFLKVMVQTDEGWKLRTVRSVVTYKDAFNDGKINPELMKLLVGSTPQKPVKSGSSSQTSRGKKGSKAVSQVQSVANLKTLEESESSFQVISEQKINPANPPLGTQVAKITGISKEQILVPSPTNTIKPGSTNGRFSKSKAKVIGVEVLDSTIRSVKGYGNVFGAVAIYEDVKVTITDTLPIEELLRPPWFSTSYANVNIGEKIYQPFFGCNSIIDDLKTEGVIKDIPELKFSKQYGAYSYSSDQKLDDVIAALEKTYQQFNAASVENAVNLLGFIYGKIRTQNLDVDAFIRSYIDRPIATLEQVLGSGIDGNLSFTVDDGGRVTVQEGLFGFHTAAIDTDLVEMGNLAGLVVDPDLQMTRVNNVGKNDQIHARDVRKAKKDRVLNYLADLSGSQGLRG